MTEHCVLQEDCNIIQGQPLNCWEKHQDHIQIMKSEAQLWSKLWHAGTQQPCSWALCRISEGSQPITRLQTQVPPGGGLLYFIACWGTAVHTGHWLALQHHSDICYLPPLRTQKCPLHTIKIVILGSSCWFFKSLVGQSTAQDLLWGISLKYLRNKNWRVLLPNTRHLWKNLPTLFLLPKHIASCGIWHSDCFCWFMDFFPLKFKRF